MPVAAANRVGVERQDGCEVAFYGSSFVTGPTGQIEAQLGRDEESVALARIDFDVAADLRRRWGGSGIGA